MTTGEKVMNEDYTEGEGCTCAAWNESDCGCRVDWTPREVYQLRDKIKELESYIKHLEEMYKCELEGLEG